MTYTEELIEVVIDAASNGTKWYEDYSYKDAEKLIKEALKDEPEEYQITELLASDYFEDSIDFETMSYHKAYRNYLKRLRRELDEMK